VAIRRLRNSDRLQRRGLAYRPLVRSIMERLFMKRR